MNAVRGKSYGPTRAGFRETFAFGVQGYVDDRIADGSGLCVWHAW